jgi:hypothetical protein
MESKSFNFDNNRVPVDEYEARILREGIEKEYKGKRNGIVELKSSSKNCHEALAKDIAEKFSSQGIIIKCKTSKGEKTITGPEPGFLYTLFYEEPRMDPDKRDFKGKQYNVDTSYLYAFEMKRTEYLDKLKNESSNHEENPFGKFPNIKVIISTTQYDHLIAEQLRVQLEEKFFHKVEIDIRDVRAYSKGPLQELYDNNDEPMILFLIMSKRHLQHSHCLNELIELKEKKSRKLSDHTIIVGADDVCDGEYSIYSTGKIKIVEFWTDQVAELDSFILKQNQKLGKKEEKHPSVKQAEKDRKIAEKITDEIISLIDFLLNESTFTPHRLIGAHFKHEHIKKVLDKQEKKPKKDNRKGTGKPS